MLLRSITKHVKEQNWFAVALDFVIVVFGVGAALLAQQWLSNEQQRTDMRLAETLLQGDLFNNYYYAKERLAVSGCRIEALQAISKKLHEPGDDWTGMPRLLRGQDRIIFRMMAFPNLLRSPSRNWRSRNWEAELGRGTFNQMDGERRDTFDSIFNQANHNVVMQDAIYTLQGRLKPLAVSSTISQVNRLQYQGMLAEIDDKSFLMELVSSQMIESIEEIGIDLPVEDQGETMNFLTLYNENGTSIYGDCFVPMTWPVFDKYISETGA
jgi:hypothetical protein